MKPKIEFIYPLTNPFNLSVPQFINSVDLSCPVQYVVIAKMNLSIHAWDIDGNITKVEFYLNNQLLGEVSTAPYSFEWFIFNNGTYGLMVKAYDNLNGINQSEIIIINVISDESGIDAATDMIENDECLV